MKDIAILFLFSVLLGLVQGLHVISKRLVNGKKVESEITAPWHVGIYDPKLLCGGTIIAPRYILSAAHCFYLSETMRFRVEAGMIRVHEPRQTANIIYVVVHKGFGSRVNYDFAIAKLERALHFDAYVAAAKLPRSPTDPLIHIGVKVDVFGYGKLTKNDKKPPNELRWLSVQTRNVDQCVGDYDGKLILDSELIICAKTPGVDICKGDLGGSMVLNGTVIGVASLTSCLTEEVPMVYGKVSNILDWIKRAIAALENKSP